MLKRIGFSTALLVAMLLLITPSGANAAVRFGVYLGAPVYTSPYPYPYPYVHPYRYPRWYDYTYGYPPYPYPYPTYLYPHNDWRPYGYHGRWTYRDHERHERHEHRRHR